MREAAAFGEQQVALSIEHGLTCWRVWGEFMVGLAAAHEGRVADGTAAMRAATQTMQQLGTVVGTTSWLYLLAEVELVAGRIDAARGHDLLAPIRARFCDGVTTADLRQADALLARWQATRAGPGGPVSP